MRERIRTKLKELKLHRSVNSHTHHIPPPVILPNHACLHRHCRTPAHGSAAQNFDRETQTSSHHLSNKQKPLRLEQTESTIEKKSDNRLAAERSEQTYHQAIIDLRLKDVERKPPKPMPSVTVETHTSERSLWDAAYEHLRAENPKLVACYEIVLSEVLDRSVSDLQPRRASSNTFANLLDYRDWTTTHRQMKELFDLWLQYGIEGSRDEAISFLGIINDTVSMTPPGAILAWVPICYAGTKVREFQVLFYIQCAIY